jgi:hypothetical protein
MAVGERRSERAFTLVAAMRPAARWSAPTTGDTVDDQRTPPDSSTAFLLSRPGRLALAAARRLKSTQAAVKTSID